jgi:peptide/nickel transport system ATP-binding protein
VSPALDRPTHVKSGNPAPQDRRPVIVARNLRVSYGSGERAVAAVRGVDLTLLPGETVGVVGESGSGKSTLVMALAGLIPESASIHADELSVLGERVTGRRRFGSGTLAGDVGVVYQDALRALNPVMRVGDQLTEGLLARGWSRPDARAHAIAMLRKVGIPEPEQRFRAYPHQLSGGMRQRVVIAMALSENPRVIVADEPTTALDVTVQAQVLELIKSLSAEIGSATLLVTHDLGVVAGTCDRVVVMYHGEIVEAAPVAELFRSPAHPYTRALIGAVPDPSQRTGSRLSFIPGAPPFVGSELPGCPFAPRCDHSVERCVAEVPLLTSVGPDRSVACHRPEGAPHGPVIRSAGAPQGARTDHRRAEPLVEVTDLVHHYRIGGGLLNSAATVHALDGVSLRIERGEALGLVGESGCGKSTLGRLLVGLDRPTAGSIRFNGQEVTGLRGEVLRNFRRRSQMIHQDPRSSLNRRMTVRTLLSEPLRLRGVPRSEVSEEVGRLLETVGLSTRHADSYPHEFSGGQSQRLAIARALALEPEFIVADEAVSALDVSVQGQVLNLLLDLREQLGLTLLFVSHDLGVVRQVCDRVAVMYLGKVVEQGPVDQVFTSPSHPYTFSLRSAIPVPDPSASATAQRVLLKGDPPRPTAPPTGCRFHPRCPMGPTVHPERAECVTTEPPLLEHLAGASSACHFMDKVELELKR